MTDDEIMTRGFQWWDSLTDDNDEVIAPRFVRMVREFQEKAVEAEFPCDGGCNVNSGPEEECSRHGRPPRELWEIIGRLSIPTSSKSGTESDG